MKQSRARLSLLEIEKQSEIMGLRSAYILQSNISRLNTRVFFKCFKYVPAPLLICLVASQSPEVKERFHRLWSQYVP